MAGHYSSKQQEQIHEVCLNEEKLENMNVNEFGVLVDLKVLDGLVGKTDKPSDIHLDCNFVFHNIHLL